MYLKYFSVAVLGLSFLSGCGKGAKADKQPVFVTNVPALPTITDNVFALSGVIPSLSYKSTMLILNPNGNPQELSDLIRVSEITRVKAANARAFVGNEKEFDVLYGHTGKLATEIQAKQEDLKKFLAEAQASATPIPLEERKKNAAGWFNETKTTLGLNADETRQLEKLFGAYCDAKIIEFAAHPTFARLAPNGYPARPSPSQLCEGYYAEKHYFEGESCTTGHYFKCLWMEGVLKSSSNRPLPLEEGDTTPSTTGSILGKIFDNDTTAENFRLILLSDAEKSKDLIVGASTAVKAQIFDKKIYFYKAVYNGTPSIGKESGCTKLLAEIYKPVCGKLARAWGWDPNIPDTLNTIPYPFLKAVENGSGLASVKDTPEMRTMAEAVKYFSVRPLDVVPPPSSNSDFYFHGLTGADIPTQPSVLSMGLTPESVSKIINMFLDKVFSLAPKDRVTKQEKEAAINALQADLNFHTNTRDALMDDASKALVEGIRVANVGEFSFGFLAYRMAVTHVDGIMYATVVFDGAKNQIFEGCYDKIALKPMDCPAKPALKEGETPTEFFHKASLNLNQAKGRIEFNMPIEDPTLVGLGFIKKKPDSPDYFMNLEPEAIQGTSLNLELYPNRLQGALDILTGKGLFYRKGTPIYEVGVSMWED